MTPGHSSAGHLIVLATLGGAPRKSNCLKSRVWPPQAVLDVLDDVDEIDASTPQVSICAFYNTLR